MRFSFVILLALVSAAVVVLVVLTVQGSADDSPSPQQAVEQCSTPGGKPPQQAILRPAESEAEEQIVRQIAQLLLEAQQEGRAVDEDQLRPLFEQLMPDRVVILGADEPLSDPSKLRC